MSRVTNIILSFDVLEDEVARAEEFNRFFTNCKPLVEVDAADGGRGWYGGSKPFEVPLYMGAFNHLPLCFFVEHLQQRVKWKHPENVRLMFCGQDQNAFSCINPTEPGASEGLGGV